MEALFEPDIIDVQKLLREKIGKIFSDFSIGSIEKILSERNEIDKLQLQLIDFAGGRKEEAIFKNEKSLIDAVLLLCEWCQMILKGNEGAEAKRVACAG
ncbi:hypothetical protein ACQ9BO_15550 [Flavobacterium sp. P21]|uniref:hypothetical protein n=1 Tax=Flavobacterium sp. P21 TaxID=3423948 RepID=UPI003D6773AD